MNDVDPAREHIYAAIAAVRERLLAYSFTVASEADLQTQIAHVLGLTPSIAHVLEFRSTSGRFDIKVEINGARVALELKIKGSAPEVERQAMRYAQDATVDAVVIVTTSRRLSAQLAQGAVKSGNDPRLFGGKPFSIVVVRGPI